MTTDYLAISQTIPGWRGIPESMAIWEACLNLDADAVVVEIGVFLGRSTALMAGARKLRGSGTVHCVDPFDCSGDAFSIPYYLAILQKEGGGNLREHFDKYMQKANLQDWIKIHQSTAQELALSWGTPVDLLLLDGDQSPRGALEAYQAWIPHLRPGGVLVVGNAPADGARSEGHDGNCRVAKTCVIQPYFYDIRQVGSTLFARKAKRL